MTAFPPPTAVLIAPPSDHHGLIVIAVNVYRPVLQTQRHRQNAKKKIGILEVRTHFSTI